MALPPVPWAARVLFYIIGAAAVVQVVLPLLLVTSKNSILFFPAASPTAAEALEDLQGLEAQLFEAARSDGRVLTGYDARPPGAPDEPVLLFFHGNAGNAAQRTPRLQAIVEGTGLRVVLASYSGYGGNPGSPSEEDIYRDALAFHDALTEQGMRGSQIVVYGESIGGAPALYAATERRCAGVIVQSTLSSLSSMAGNAYSWLPLTRVLTAGLFPNTDRGSALEIPLWIVHGGRDRVIPFSEAEKLKEAAPASELLRIPAAGHNDLLETAGAEYLFELSRRVHAWTTAPVQ